MATYIDGFVLRVPKNKAEEYRQMAEGGKESWLRHGALAYFECKGDDLEAKEMGGQKNYTFLELTNASPDEDVWFSFIVFKSREHRDEVNAKVHAEMAETYADMKDEPMPFDMDHMAYGGFEAQVEGKNGSDF